jgi:hypothetical protein
MKEKLHLFAIHQTATSLQRTDDLNPRTILYPALDESNWMKSAYFIINPGRKPPPQNGCQLKSGFFLKAPVSHPPLSQFNRTFQQNQPAAITLNTGSPQTLLLSINTLQGWKSMHHS